MTLQPRSLVVIVAGVALLAWAVGASWLPVAAAAAVTAFVLVILTRPLPARRPFQDDIPGQLDEARSFSLANAALWGGLMFGFFNASGGTSAADATGGLDGPFDAGGGFDAGGFTGGGPE